jgi:NADPH-dependent glutamate synthase beta subunit-like oxidoreductase
MPAWEREINEAVEEGIRIVNGFGPNKFLGRGGRISGVEFKRCLSAFDEKGAFSPKYDESDLTTMQTETVIIAIGQAPDASLAQQLKLPTNSGGFFIADPITLETSTPGVFAGGDACYGPKTVADAIGCGKEASVSIDRYLRGLDLYTGREWRDAKLTAITQPVKEKYDPAPRTPITWLPVEERMSSDEVQLGLTGQTALQEAKRCIACGTSCVQACPYGVMQFNHTVLKAVKCDLCIDKQRNNEAPACSWACPAHCIYWGDADTFPAGVDKGLQTIVP